MAKKKRERNKTDRILDGIRNVFGLTNDYDIPRYLGLINDPVPDENAKPLTEEEKKVLMCCGWLSGGGLKRCRGARV